VEHFVFFVFSWNWMCGQMVKEKVANQGELIDE